MQKKAARPAGKTDDRRLAGAAAARVVPGPDPGAAAVLGRAGLRDPAALRHGGGRRHLPSGHHLARARPQALERGLRAALAPAQGRPLRREPEPAAALLPVPGDHEAVAGGLPGPLPGEPRRASASTRWCTTSASSRTTGRARRSAPGGSAGRCGATAWRCRSSPTSSRSAASTAIPSRARSPTGSSGSPCTCRASTACSTSTSTAAPTRASSPTATCSCRPSRSTRATISSTPTPRCCWPHFRDAEKECKALLDAGAPKPEANDKRHKLALPAYDQCIKASHIFNLLDARGVISVTERQSYILRVRELAKACCGAWLQTEGGGA